MANLLLCHELDEVLVIGGDAGVFEVLCRKLREAVTEEVEFDVLLVEGECLGK